METVWLLCRRSRRYPLHQRHETDSPLHRYLKRSNQRHRTVMSRSLRSLSFKWHCKSFRKRSKLLECHRQPRRHPWQLRGAVQCSSQFRSRRPRRYGVVLTLPVLPAVQRSCPVVVWVKSGHSVLVHSSFAQPFSGGSFGEALKTINPTTASQNDPT